MDRTYSKAFEINRAAPAFLYIEDPTLNDGSGAWRPYRTTDGGGGGGGTTISGDVNVSGIGQLILDTDEVEALIRSGNAFINSGNGFLTISNSYLASISGDIRFLRTGTQSVSVSNVVGISGTKVDNASGYTPNSFLMGGGRAVDVSGGFNPQYGSGANAMFNLDRANGALLTENTDLNYNYDSVVAYPPQSSVVSNASISGGFTGIALQTGVALLANAGRKAWFIANTSNSAPLYVRFGSSLPTANNFNFILNPASSAGQQGGSWSDSPAQYIGAVSVSGQSFIAWEI